MEDTAMKSRYTRILSVLLCAALACSILAGCSTAASSSEAPSSADESQSVPASSEVLPDSTTRADTSGLNPGDFDENSIFSIQNTEAAFAPCLGWGPGVSGCSLKSVIAAASLLGWAESGNLAMRSTDAIQDAYTTWFNDLSADDQASFADAWPLIKEDANTLLTDKASMEGRISDAGLNAKKLPGCSKENWNALQKVVDALVPQSSEY